MKLSVSKHQLLSTLCVAVACAAAVLAAGATSASAKILGTPKTPTTCAGENQSCNSLACCPGFTCKHYSGGSWCTY